MSMYDNYQKDDVYYYMSEFLKEHTISELLQIVTDVIMYEKED